jgi:transposase InsO family protein
MLASAGIMLLLQLSLQRRTEAASTGRQLARTPLRWSRGARHAKQIHQPAFELQTIPLTWPFAIWGLDILGPFPRAQGGYRYLYVAIDKFTKWVEVEPVCTISARSAVKFIRGLVCRFGVPNRIITDNGSQFTSGLFWEYCASAGIKICFACPLGPSLRRRASLRSSEVGLYFVEFGSTYNT